MDLRREGTDGVGSWWHAGEGPSRASERVRYAVVGLGALSQTAILPAFGQARANSELVALVSGDPEKLQLFGRKYRVKHLYDYHGYEDCLASGEIDAVYVALPNNQHREFTVRAARAGVHVLCERPMAVDVEESEAMRAACRVTAVKLMIGYRLHFEEGNVRAKELVRSGRLGELRSIHATVATAPSIGPWRAAENELAGGPLLELGVDCIRTARELFGAEPVEVAALAARGRRDPRFYEGEETTAAILRFPGDRIATFTASARAMEGSSYDVHGTEGCLRLDHAYSLTRPMTLRASVKGRTREKAFRKRDPFGQQLLYFSECILSDREPLPSGAEGLRDLIVVEALRRAARTGQAVTLDGGTLRAPAQESTARPAGLWSQASAPHS